MFQQLVNSLGGGPDRAVEVLAYRPSEIAEFLEDCWRNRSDAVFEGLPPAPVQPPGPQTPPDPRLEDERLRGMARPEDYALDGLPPIPQNVAAPPPPVWPHLVYAYMLEQTRMVAVFRQVLERFIYGHFTFSSSLTRNWIRVTEELFFASPRLPSVASLESHLRPDFGARRRNAYFRLLGMDLTHGTDDGRPYGYVKPDLSNRDFPTIFEALLGEVWRAYTNRNNGIGPDTTDDIGMSDLLRRLYDMLTTRRLLGALGREEFEAVALMSWFNLTLAFQTPIAFDLTATGSSVTERLLNVSQRVGVPVHSRSDSYIQMALPLSNILRGIENGAITGVGGAQALYLLDDDIRRDMLTIITHWSITTGRNLKDAAASQVRAVQPSPFPLTPSPVPSPNGGGSRIAAALR